MGSIVVAPPEHATSIDSLTLSDRHAAYACLEPIFSFIYLFGHIVVDTYFVNTRALAAAAAEKNNTFLPALLELSLCNTEKDTYVCRSLKSFLVLISI